MSNDGSYASNKKRLLTRKPSSINWLCQMSCIDPRITINAIFWPAGREYIDALEMYALCDGKLLNSCLL
jgi:hypothetical protein